MSIAAAQPGPLTERRWPTLVGRDCASIGAGIEPMAEQLVGSDSLRAGDSVLDVASGTGNVAIVAARRGCAVTAVDDVEALLEHGRARRRRGTPRHPHRGRRHAAALCRCIVRRRAVLRGGHVRAARELVRVCRAGGTIALANWTPAGFVGRIFQTLASTFPPCH